VSFYGSKYVWYFHLLKTETTTFIFLNDLPTLLEALDIIILHLRFNINFLSDRLIAAIDWQIRNPDASKLSFEYYGASTEAAAATVTVIQSQYWDLVK
jgi:hypothetical protein